MVKIIQTDNLPSNLGKVEALHVYNGLDTCITLEVFDVISQYLDNTTRATYEFSKALQAPILEMNMRGVLIDQEFRFTALDEYRADLARVEANLYEILREGIGVEPFDGGSKSKPSKYWRSNDKLINLFYEVMQIPPVTKRNDKGQYVPTVNREALEKLKAYHYAEPIVSHILTLRDIGKTIGVLETEIDPDSRIRTTYNIAGTDTGRLSSRLSDFGTGTNLQNISPRLRRMFVSDPGFKFANVDLSQADARGVGAIIFSLFGDTAYLDACESGDLHTTVCRLAWQELDWSGNARAVADQIAYRGMSYRDLAKRLGHGTNYLGTPRTMARHTKTQEDLIRDFQQRYFGAFPYIRKWHEHVRNTLLTDGYITTLLGRKRWFFGRRNDDTTLRAAVAYEPQSITADLIDRGLLRLWRDNICTLLLQVHDSVLVQYPEDQEDSIVPRILAAIEQPIEVRGRQIIVPAEAQTGWNWAYASESNPDGLKKYSGHDLRRRTSTPKTSILDRRFL